MSTRRETWTPRPAGAGALCLGLILALAPACAGPSAAGRTARLTPGGAAGEDDQLAPAEDLKAETSSLAVSEVVSSTSAPSLESGAPGPNEAIDLEMEAERANEEAVLDALERGGPPPKIRSILAVTGTVSFDIPMIEHELVDEWTRYFMGPGRKWYQIWLSRSTRYVPIFHQVLEKHGLPRDLIFLSMIESGFAPQAYSWAHAAGQWQFVPFTGKRYGLQIDFWLDERRDFERATEAAALYLKKLYDEFGDWYLAWAAYNAGEARVELAIRKAGTRDFWKLSKTRWLRRETSHYVPKLLAAAVVSKQPERFGFDAIEYQPPMKWEVVTVTTAVDLATLAKACGDPALEAELKSLNPALRRYVTPPGKSYDVRVPLAKREVCRAGLRAIPEAERLTYRYHRVGRGDTPASIAKRYHTTTDAIVRFNNLDAKRLKLYGDLVIPVPATKDAEIPVIKPPNDLLEPAAFVPEGGSSNVIVHRVRSGDSLWKIAQRYHVDVKKLRLWNGLWQNSPLKIGQAIRIYRTRGT